MITHFFGFTKKPFPRNVEHKDLYSWKALENLRLRLEYFIKEGGIFLLTGLIGSGKTIALKAFLHSTNPNTHRLVYLNSSMDTKKDFYRTMLAGCGLTPPFFAGDCRNMIRKHFLDMRFTKNITPVIILDEAQNLPPFILEEVRLLSNYDYDSSSPALFILAGHKLLQQRIALHENEALRQRLTLKYHLMGLSLEETCGYINHWLSIAGSTGSIFTDSVIPKIHEESGGIPRMINNICNAMFLAAVINEKKIIDDHLFNATKHEWK